MVSAAQSRLATRTIFFLAAVLVFRWIFSSGSSTTTKSNGGKLVTSREIQAHNVIDRIRGDKSLDVHKHEFLQSRMGQFESFPLLIEGEKKGEERGRREGSARKEPGRWKHARVFWDSISRVGGGRRAVCTLFDALTRRAVGLEDTRAGRGGGARTEGRDVA